MDTIFALASARGKAGVAVVRISGPSAPSAGAALCGDLPTGRGLRKLTAPDGVVLDEALVLVFPAGQSFTGEDVVELQVHGSTAVIDAKRTAGWLIFGSRATIFFAAAASPRTPIMYAALMEPNCVLSVTGLLMRSM